MSRSTLSSPLRQLYQSLDRRMRPEDVADLIDAARGEAFRSGELTTLRKASRRSLRRSVQAFSSMLADFIRPVPMDRPLEVARQVFRDVEGLRAEDCAEPEKIEPYIRRLNSMLRKTPFAHDFVHDRLNRGARRAAGLEISRRQYNKRFRILARLEDRLTRLMREIDKRRLALAGRSGLAVELDWEQFSRDPDTACFIAYYVARANLRSEFTISGQQKPFDDIAEVLFERATQSSTCNALAIAHVYPEVNVLKRLTDKERGQLLAGWLGLMRKAAGILEHVWNTSHINRKTMIVRRGNDSSTWNMVARAWNTARTNWLATIEAMGLEGMLEHFCPGKVPVLIAADVAAWHRSTGGGLHPDTHVWAALPYPWEVLDGRVRCGSERVAKLCQEHRLNPKTSGWVGSRERGLAVEYRPTPELVHGVTVADPKLATALRQAGWFSGKVTSKRGKENVQVNIEHSPEGFISGASRLIH